MSTALPPDRFRPFILMTLVIASVNLTGCAYTQAMAKAEADRSRVNAELREAEAEQINSQSRTTSLKSERESLGKEIAAQKRLLASLERRLAAVSVVPIRRRSSGQQAEVGQLQSNIASTQRRLDEKKERYRSLNEKL